MQIQIESGRDDRGQRWTEVLNQKIEWCKLMESSNPAVSYVLDFVRNSKSPMLLNLCDTIGRTELYNYTYANTITER
jgi:hypothetical protein